MPKRRFSAQRERMRELREAEAIRRAGVLSKMRLSVRQAKAELLRSEAEACPGYSGGRYAAELVGPARGRTSPHDLEAMAALVERATRPR